MTNLFVNPLFYALLIACSGYVVISYKATKKRVKMLIAARK